MVFQKGCNWWEARTKHGRDAIFTDPEKFRESCVEYFQYCKDNPLLEQRIGFSKGRAVKDTIEKKRVPTVGGLCLFLQISTVIFYQWKNDRDDLRPVIDWAEECIKQEKFAGATAGLYNANIIARDLGLKDHQAIDHNVPPIIIEAPEGQDPGMPPIYDGK